MPYFLCFLHLLLATEMVHWLDLLFRQYSCSDIQFHQIFTSSYFENRFWTLHYERSTRIAGAALSSSSVQFLLCFCHFWNYKRSGSAARDQGESRPSMSTKFSHLLLLSQRAAMSGCANSQTCPAERLFPKILRFKGQNSAVRTAALQGDLQRLPRHRHPSCYSVRTSAEYLF